MNENEHGLKPCPFCGNKAIFIGETRSIKCTKCGGAFVVANPLISRLEVARAWNKRTPQREADIGGAEQ